MTRILDQLRPEFELDADFIAVNTDDERNWEFARRCHVLNLPALAFFRDGRLLRTLTGLRSEAEWREILLAFTL